MNRNVQRTKPTMSEQLIYSNTTQGSEYKLMTEGFDDCQMLTMRRLSEKYPTIQNIYYGWGECIDTSKPNFSVADPLKVLNDVWKNINQLNTGVYMVAALDQRTMNIYYKRWLCNPKWVFLESGFFGVAAPFIIFRKLPK